MRWILIFLAICGLPAAAQVSETQQCIWRCLAASTGASDPAYHQCVSAQCSGEPQVAARPPSGNPTTVWQHGWRSDGTGYAGIDAPGYPGQVGVYFFCRRPGQAYLRLVGLDGGGAEMLLVVGTTGYIVRFDWQDEGLIARLSTASPLLSALQSESVFQVQTAQGKLVMNLSLVGARRALAEVISAC